MGQNQSFYIMSDKLKLQQLGRQFESIHVIRTTFVSVSFAQVKKKQRKDMRFLIRLQCWCSNKATSSNTAHSHQAASYIMEILCEITKLVSHKFSQNGIICRLQVNEKAWGIYSSKFIIILNEITIIILNENIANETSFQNWEAPM